LTIVYLVLQGVGDGIQPLMSQFYGAGKKEDLSHANRFAYLFALLLSFLSIVLLYVFRGSIGVIFGASADAVLPKHCIVICISRKHRRHLRSLRRRHTGSGRYTD